ncbi:MAG: class I SAM-dependent methyltransferase [Lachnospiraceae bacterium]|nr:class I SAM-dependent methyltransferase [Lachnospiraceae bacterium]
MRKVFSSMQSLLICVVRWEAAVLKRLTGQCYRLLYWLEWFFPYGTRPLSMDHNIDVFYLWDKGHINWMMRAGNNYMPIMKFQQAKILEIGCGDGFYCGNIYGKINGARIIACDSDKKTLKKAEKQYGRNKNIQFILCDIRYEIPEIEEGYTNIIWDASMNFFTEEELIKIMNAIKEALSFEGGILSGCAVINNKEQKWDEYNFLFESSNDLNNFLKGYFKNVKIAYNGNVESYAYFMASDSDIILY